MLDPYRSDADLPTHANRAEEKKQNFVFSFLFLSGVSMGEGGKKSDDENEKEREREEKRREERNNAAALCDLHDSHRIDGGCLWGESCHSWSRSNRTVQWTRRRIEWRLFIAQIRRRIFRRLENERSSWSCSLFLEDERTHCIEATLSGWCGRLASFFLLENKCISIKGFVCDRCGRWRFFKHKRILINACANDFYGDW